MGYEHHYDLIKEVDESKAVPHPVVVPVVTSWWKFLLCNLLAACLGAGAMFAIMRDAVPPQLTTDAATPATAAAETATTIVSSIATTTTPALVLTLPTTAVDQVQGNILGCGGNPEEARARGCVFDVMMQDWVPEPCYDSVLTERYLAAGKWTWYADGEGKTTLTDEQMRKGEHGSAWMSSSYHKAHCVFSWLKIVRALRLGRGISQELLSYDHVLHCAHGALKEDSNDEGLGVSAPTNYAHCALYETWKQNLIPDRHDSTE